MNERIKELAEQAGLYDEKTPEEVPGFTASFEKFAELIVKECGQWWTNRLVVEPDYGLPHRIERNRAVPCVIKEFNKHFGIEE
jgi:hypothetical protein